MPHKKNFKEGPKNTVKKKYESDWGDKLQKTKQ